MLLHCWKCKSEDVELGSKEWVDSMENPGTCMLEKGHIGPHIYTPDHKISVRFSTRKED